MTKSPDAEPVHHVEGWTRNGFLGERVGWTRKSYAPDYVSAHGPHAPRRMMLANVDCADESDAGAMPTVFGAAKSGLRLSVSKRSAAMPFAYCNVECDEAHFIQDGEIEFRTDQGVLVAGPGDFVCVPRSVAYCATPLTPHTLSLITESPGALKFDTPAPAGMIHFGRDVIRAKPDDAARPNAPKRLLLKSEDDITIFEKTFDPLAHDNVLTAPSAVWKLNLARIHPVTYWPHGGPPAHFLASPGGELLFYTLSARPGARPPVHHNADYDEIILYFRGPDPWGEVRDPGTWTWVPKGVPHHGPPEDAPNGFWAWMLETRTTLRLTPAGVAASEPMETGLYGVHKG